MTSALFETEVGDINIEFFSDDAPNTVKNFTNLISDGFYDGLAFHRVIPGFMAVSYTHLTLPTRTRV